MALRAARILSSETDNTIKQEQTTNVNIKVNTQPKEKENMQQQHISAQPSYVGFTQGMEASAYPSVQPINNQYQQDASMLESEVAELTKKNKFLELLLAAYQQNPIRINSVIICNYRLLIEMIKLLTDADKVDLVLNDDISCDCSGCCADVDHDELVYISRILVTKNSSTNYLKYAYNDVHSKQQLSKRYILKIANMFLLIFARTTPTMDR